MFGAPIGLPLPAWLEGQPVEQGYQLAERWLLEQTMVDQQCMGPRHQRGGIQCYRPAEAFGHRGRCRLSSLESMARCLLEVHQRLRPPVRLLAEFACRGAIYLPEVHQRLRPPVRLVPRGGRTGRVHRLSSAATGGGMSMA